VRRAGLIGAAAGLAAALGAPAAAQAAYTGSVDAGARTATLTGSAPVSVSTSGGVLHHGNLGPGFASDIDFDSTAAGDQTVPDTGGWAVNVTGGGSDTLEVVEGEPVAVAYASGHTFFPGGVPCVVRDLGDRGGSIRFSAHPDQETRFCYPSGFKSVTVRGGSGPVDFTVLDTEEGVPLHLNGGSGDDAFAEAANVPSSVGVPHQPLSAVHFSGGAGNDRISFVDGDATAPATYGIGNGAFRKSGMPPLYFDTTVEGFELYPQEGPSKIAIEKTGGDYVQIFGNFFGQAGPYRIDGTGSDAALIVTGSTGADTIIGSSLSEYLGGGGGNDTIRSIDAVADTVACEGGVGTVDADNFDQVEGCGQVRRVAPLIGLTRAAFEPKRVKRGKKLNLGAVSTADGKLTLTFRRGKRSVGTRTVAVKAGPNTLKLASSARRGGRSRKLGRGRYTVSARLRASDGKRGPAVKLPLTIR
jgi:hypothetical protein